MLNIVITAGGTQEKIDGVRYITNSSSGKLGNMIGQSFVNELTNANIYYVHSKTAQKLNIEKSGINVENIQISSVNDLENTVKNLLTEKKIDIFIHSMAVSDYTTDFVFDLNEFKRLLLEQEQITEDIYNDLLEKSKLDNSKKLSSNSNLSISLKQTPKVIEMIKKISPYTFLVGFKLLNNVTDEKLFEVGFDLLRKNRCNLILGNDINKIRSGNHAGMLIYPEKSYEIFNGKEDIALNLVKIVLKRYKTRHPKSIQENVENGLTEESDIYLKIKNIGKKLYDDGLLPEVINHDRADKVGTYGNLSVFKDGVIYITSRNVHKGNLKPDDISKIDDVIEVNEDSVYSNVHYRSKNKPSIDTSIHYFIYKETKYTATLHIHTNDVYLGIPYIDEQYPCGSEAEKDAILEKLKTSSIVQMKNHGLIICGRDLNDCYSKLCVMYATIPRYKKDSESNDKEALSHIKEVGADFTKKYGHLYNIFLGKEIIGVIWENITNDVNFGIFTKSNKRRGLHIVERYLKLYDKPYNLYTMKNCNVIDFYKSKYGFKEVSITDGLCVLTRK